MRICKAKEIVLSSTVLLSLTGCGAKENSSDVNQARVYTAYELSYSEGDQSLKQGATFYFGNNAGTYLVLDQGASVTADGSPLNSDGSVLNTATYSKHASLAATTAVSKKTQFIYTNNNGQVYTNQIAMVSPASLKASGSNVIQIGQDYNFCVDVSDPQNQDVVGFSLTQDTQSYYQTIHLDGLKESCSKILAQDTLTLHDGALLIELDRHTEGTPTQAPDAGGSTEVSYSKKFSGYSAAH